MQWCLVCLLCCGHYVVDSTGIIDWISAVTVLRFDEHHATGVCCALYQGDDPSSRVCIGYVCRSQVSCRLCTVLLSFALLQLILVAGLHRPWCALSPNASTRSSCGASRSLLSSRPKARRSCSGRRSWMIYRWAETSQTNPSKP